MTPPRRDEPPVLEWGPGWILGMLLPVIALLVIGILTGLWWLDLGFVIIVVLVILPGAMRLRS